VLFIPAGERGLTQAGGLSPGIVSATQGPYSPAQFLLDVGQGARVGASLYAHPRPPALALARSAHAWLIRGWRAARARAQSAPQTLEPGLLAQQIHGGAGYVGFAGQPAIDSVLAAGRGGRIASVSVGSASTVLARVEQLQRTRRLVVADLPGGRAGLADLRALTGQRRAGELLMAVQRAPAGSDGELLWIAAAGLPGPRGGELTSPGTREQGLVSATDLAPTILAHLGLAVPAAMIGRPITQGADPGAAALAGLMPRLRVISGRRLPALALLLAAWALLALLQLAFTGTARGALRAGALGMLWSPVAVLVPAALEPGAAVEYTMIIALCLGLGALSDRLLTWPRALIAPAAVAVLALSTDALSGTQLLMRSLLGPDPAGGARFYGIGNELKAALAVIVLAAVAAALYPTTRPLRGVRVLAGAGIVLGILEGSARIGAGVGGVILVSFSFALAAAMMLPGLLTRRRAVIVVLCPPGALVALAAIDLATAHGGGHFTGTVLQAHSPGELHDLIVRRYTTAWQALDSVSMALALGVSLLLALASLRRADLVLAPVGGDRAFAAALAGGLAAGAVGTLVEDSGPLLLVSAVLALACVLAYLHARPAPSGADTPRPARQPERVSKAGEPELEDLLV